MSSRRKVVAVALASLLLASCAALLGPRTVTLSEDELSRRLAERFPLDRRLLELFDLRIATPRVTLLPQTNRIGIDVELSLADALSRRAFPMALSLESALRYDPAQSAVTLADVHVQQLGIDGLPPSLAPTMRRFGAPLVEQMLEGGVVHRFTPEQLRLAEGRGWRPDVIAVTPRGVEITLQPIAR